MTTSEKDSGAEAPATPGVKSKDDRSRLRRGDAIFNLLAISALLILYLAAGDRTAWGEFFTIWPSLLWGLPLLPLLILGTLHNKLRWAVWQWALFAAFLVLTVEWRPLLRLNLDKRREAFETARDSSTGGGAFPLRIVSWNINTASSGRDRILVELAPLRPDICFFQETPDDEKPFQENEPSGAWADYHWYDAGDCGILSRYPMTQLDFGRVGPWDKPAAMIIDLPGGRKLACVNVRLMLPSLVLNPFPRANRARQASDHDMRVKQFPALNAEITRVRRETKLNGLILAGDFNTPADAFSERILRTSLKDVWREAGCGWGATMTSSFPVSRIDQCWVSSEFSVSAAWVGGGELSDHRYLVADLFMSP